MCANSAQQNIIIMMMIIDERMFETHSHKTFDSQHLIFPRENYKISI